MNREQLVPPAEILTPPPIRILVPGSLGQIAELSRTDTQATQSQIAQLKLDQQLAAEATNHPTTFDRSGYEDVRAFFDEAAPDYDSDLENPYFAFAHDILRHILQTYIARHFDNQANIRMFDAGAGTGNWSKFVLGLNESIQATLFDMNPMMLRVARQKLGNIRDKAIEIMEGNLEDATQYPAEKSNLILCMHNVIGMGRNVPLILGNLYQHLEQNGLAFIMTSNKYQAYEFVKNYRGDEEARRVAQDGTVKYKANMPEMFCYTPDEFKRELTAAGFEKVTVLGFPVTLKPAHADTHLKQRQVSHPQLRDPWSRQQLLNLEKQLCLNPELAYRAGSSLIAVCRKLPLDS